MIVKDPTPEMAIATVAEIALHFPQSIAIFNRYNLDYCCNGKKSFVQMCSKSDLEPETIWNEILDRQRNSSVENHLRFESWEPSLLIDFIVQHHHKYVRDSIPQLEILLKKVCTVHGADHPHLLAIKDEFYLLADELRNHLPKEENILFPAIKQISKNEESGLTNLQIPILVMEHEHETAGKLIISIRFLSGHYTPPANACLSFQMTYKLLQEFESDLMQHIHLENNILFPKALELALKS